MKKKHIILIPSLLALLIVSYLILNFLNSENKEVLSKTKIEYVFAISPSFTSLTLNRVVIALKGRVPPDFRMWDFGRFLTFSTYWL